MSRTLILALCLVACRGGPDRSGTSVGNPSKTTLSIAEAHDLSTRLQESVRAGLPNVGEVLVHLEPVDEGARG